MKRQKINKKELLTIPNIMGYFRILLIPLFAWVYLTAKTDKEYYIAAILIGISGITDLLDGKIARRFHMVTEFGKFLDPLADKLTQGVLILCLSTRYPFMWILVGLFLIKEGFMAIMGLIMLGKGKKLDGAMWFGKVCTATLYFVLFIFLLFPHISIKIANIVILFCGVMMLATLFLYIPVFYKMHKQRENET